MSTSNITQLRIGFCGFGASASHFHMPLIRQEPGLNLIAVFDPIFERTQCAKQRGFQFTLSPEDLEKAIRELSLDIIVVTSPNTLHYVQAKTALEAGAHVLVDKPLALCSEEVNLLVDLANRKNLVLMAFQNRRYDDDHLQALEIVQSQEIGEIIRIDAAIASWGPSNKFAVPDFCPTWRTEKSYGGGGLYDWGPHILDQLLRFANWKLPNRIHAIGRSSIWSTDCDDILIAIYDWENFSARVLISAVDMAPVERLRICGTKGTVVVRGDDNHGEVIKYSSTTSESRRYSNSLLLATPIYRALIHAITTGQRENIVRYLDNTKKLFSLIDQTRQSFNF
ncbi:Gfo/Idh/MocA family oxidoreductase [Planktothrix sp. FACHB-1355]|uniref:Gfo/Idh/MocA family oxidoreductase n=2 Tax=Cyanophyceae TaxID=3028117 RepID=A0A926VBQ0_9CYAN|nr:Gfo/Idh/MocA family oxidoreductase [Aerosakkonema funiforme FACHB-1375]MBD3557640.1 Gfo/Idh/MocA family oxidoreductase [Planktothrix sp. FACHB-1355]